MLTERCALLGTGGGLPQSASSRWSSKMGAGSIIRCSVQIRYVPSRGEPVDRAQRAVSSNASIRLRNVVAAPFLTTRNRGMRSPEPRGNKRGQTHSAEGW